MKIYLAEAMLFHVEGRLELSKLIIAFRNFGKAAKNM